MLKNLPVWLKGLLLALLVLGTLIYGQGADSQGTAQQTEAQHTAAQHTAPQWDHQHEADWHEEDWQDDAQQAAAQQTAAQQTEDERESITLDIETRWYRSNASGMALERMLSRTAAQRNEYALSVSQAARNDLPYTLLRYYNSSFTIELRTLFHDLEIHRQQWIFRDSQRIVRLNASGSHGLWSDGQLSDDEKGFIEVYDADQALIEERIFSGRSETISVFTYSGDLLTRAEIWIKEASQDSEESDPSEVDEVVEIVEIPGTPWGPNLSPPDITDVYRYTRSASLRAIERIYHSGYSLDSRRRIPFPSIGPIFPQEPDFESPVVAHSSEFLGDIMIPPGGRVIYTTDNRGRILSERRLDEDGRLQGELINTWSGDRLASVSWVSGDDEWLIEYEYDEQGNRIMERNINRGVLERTIRSDGNREVEELFINDVVVLRAIWENGRKISEERVRSR